MSAGWLQCRVAKLALDWAKVAATTTDMLGAGKFIEDVFVTAGCRQLMPLAVVVNPEMQIWREITIQTAFKSVRGSTPSNEVPAGKHRAIQTLRCRSHQQRQQ
jgi:hypothetical protein